MERMKASIKSLEEIGDQWLMEQREDGDGWHSYGDSFCLGCSYTVITFPAPTPVFPSILGLLVSTAPSVADSKVLPHSLQHLWHFFTKHPLNVAFTWSWLPFAACDKLLSFREVYISRRQRSNSAQHRFIKPYVKLFMSSRARKWKSIGYMTKKIHSRKKKEREQVRKREYGRKGAKYRNWAQL